MEGASSDDDDDDVELRREELLFTGKTFRPVIGFCCREDLGVTSVADSKLEVYCARSRFRWAVSN